MQRSLVALSLVVVSGCSNNEANFMNAVTPKPKDYKAVAIPDNVVKDLTRVHEWIEADDETTKIPTDDGIQIGCLCGGLMDDGRFYFSVHIDNPYKWDIALTRDDIRRIVNGEHSEISRWCGRNPECGFKTYIEDITCHWCDYGGDRTPR